MSVTVNTSNYDRIPSSGPINMNDVRFYVGTDGMIDFASLKRGGAYIPNGYAENAGIPAVGGGGSIDAGQLRGAKTVKFDRDHVISAELVVQTPSMTRNPLYEQTAEEEV